MILNSFSEKINEVNIVSGGKFHLEMETKDYLTVEKFFMHFLIRVTTIPILELPNILLHKLLGCR
jgi:hypothetical protein